MNIGQAAQASGVSAKMIRHYEEIGMLPKASRTPAGYRVYSEGDVHTLRFVRHARDLGFSMKEIGELLNLWQNRRRASSSVKRLAEAHMAELDERIRQLAAMKDTLATLVRHCHGDQRPECPILEKLAS